VVPLTKQKRLQRLSETAVWQVRLSEVCRQTVPDSRSSCTESSVAQVGARPTYEKRTSVNRVQSSWTGVGDEAALVSQVSVMMEGVGTFNWTRCSTGIQCSWRWTDEMWLQRWMPSPTERQTSGSNGCIGRQVICLLLSASKKWYC